MSSTHDSIESLMLAFMSTQLMPSLFGHAATTHSTSNARTARTKTQAKQDCEKEREHQRHFYSQLEKCCKQGICFCQYEELETQKPLRKRCRFIDRILREAEQARLPYATWTCEDLKAAAKQRGLTLTKKRTKQALTSVLIQADSQRHFRLLDLPAEIKLRIYELALCDDKDRRPSNRRDVAKPALLQTCRQIREKATPVFYRGNRFVLSLFDNDIGGMFEADDEGDDDEGDDEEGDDEEGDDEEGDDEEGEVGDNEDQDHEQPEQHNKRFQDKDNAWLQRLDPAEIKDLRRIAFRLNSGFDTYDVQVDLTFTSPEGWLLPFGTEPFECPCKRVKKWTMAEWYKFCDDDESKARNEVLEDISSCMKAAKSATEKFQNLCGKGTEVQPTLAGIDVLATTALQVLNGRDYWLFGTAVG